MKFQASTPGETSAGFVGWHYKTPPHLTPCTGPQFQPSLFLERSLCRNDWKSAEDRNAEETSAEHSVSTRWRPCLGKPRMPGASWDFMVPVLAGAGLRVQQPAIGPRGRPSWRSPSALPVIGGDAGPLNGPHTRFPGVLAVENLPMRPGLWHPRAMRGETLPGAQPLGPRGPRGFPWALPPPAPSEPRSSGPGPPGE